MKIYTNWVTLIFLFISMFWTLSMFLAPLTVAPGTVVGLDGGSNAYDFGHIWDKMNPYAKAVYAFGDTQCHQMSSRSYYINGNQMPMCSRCVALFLFANLGIATAMLLKPQYNLSDTVMDGFPKKFRNWVRKKNLQVLIWFLIILFAIMPTLVDGILQIATTYESTNLKRVIFSISTGWVAGFAVALMFNNIHYQTYAEKYQTPRKSTVPR
jgi:uncharacterized membrane protein